MFPCNSELKGSPLYTDLCVLKVISTLFSNHYYLLISASICSIHNMVTTQIKHAILLNTHPTVAYNILQVVGAGIRSTS